MGVGIHPVDRMQAGECAEDEAMDVIERCRWFNLAEPEFGRQLLIALLATAAEQEGVCGQRSAAALAAVPRIGGYTKMKERRWFNPVLTPLDRFNRWAYQVEPQGSMTEWAWEGGPIMIAVRVEIEVRSYDDSPALERCMRTLKRQGMPTHGLLLLDREPRPPERLPNPKRRQYLGAISWADAEPRLRTIRPGSELSCEEWDAILDGLCSPQGVEAR